MKSKNKIELPAWSSYREDTYENIGSNLCEIYLKGIMGNLDK